MNDLVNTLAPCGLICGLCANASTSKGGCVGCADGGGNPDCEQRKCTVLKQITGCWECDDFPCDKGYLAVANVEWRGMCIASIQSIRHHSVSRFIDEMMKRFSDGIEYRKYRYKSPEECELAFYSQDNTQALN